MRRRGALGKTKIVGARVPLENDRRTSMARAILSFISSEGVPVK